MREYCETDFHPPCRFYNDYLVSDTRHERPCGYLAQTALLQQVPELLADVLEPDYCALTSSNDAGPTTMNAWLGPEGTVSPLHTDPRHNVFCQIAGSKVVLLFPAAAPGLYPFTVGLTTNTSQVDAERPNMDSFPMYAHAPGSNPCVCVRLCLCLSTLGLQAVWLFCTRAMRCLSRVECGTTSRRFSRHGACRFGSTKDCSLPVHLFNTRLQFWPHRASS